MNTGCSTDFAAAAVCEAPRCVQGELAAGFDDGRMSAMMAVVAAALAATAAGVEVGVAGVAEDAGAGAGVGVGAGADAGVAAAYKSVVDYAGLVC